MLAVGLSEDDAIRILSEELGNSRASRLVRVGIGDDAAVVQSVAGREVCTVDSCEEGVHFLSEWMTPEDVARKSFHSALSDVAAMGATPIWGLSHLTLGRQTTSSWLRRFARAQATCAREVPVPVVGGNVSFSAATSVVMAFTGSTGSGAPLLRTGARPGEEIWLVGDVGLARAGLLSLQQQPTRARGRGVRGIALTAFRSPEAQVRKGKKLVGRASACLDVSDGLARDAGQLAQASDVKMVLSSELVERASSPALHTLARQLSLETLELALEGGEDYALLATGPRSRRPRFCHVIGRVDGVGHGGQAGAYLDDGRQIRRLSSGFVHGRST